MSLCCASKEKGESVKIRKIFFITCWVLTIGYNVCLPETNCTICSNLACFAQLIADIIELFKSKPNCLNFQFIHRTYDLIKSFSSYMCVNLGGFWTLMT